jgi:Family of unknown function (DUF5681)
MERDSSGRFTPGTSGNPAGRPKGSLSKLTSLAKALTEPQAKAIIKRALTEATVLWDQKFVLFFMERMWPRSQTIDDGHMERLEDLERRVIALEEQAKSEN